MTQFHCHVPVCASAYWAIEDSRSGVIPNRCSADPIVMRPAVIRGNDAATEDGFRERGVDSGLEYLLVACTEEFDSNPARVKIDAAKPAA